MDEKNMKQAAQVAKNGVSVMEDFKKSLPWLDTLDSEIAQLKSHISILADIREVIADSAATYAETHTTALDEPLTEVFDGTRNGSVAMGGKTFRLTVSRGPAKRASGDNMTQAFLKKLPKDWVKSKLVASHETISSQSDDILKKYGLVRPVKRVWTVD